jgi:hypothetical protein
VTAGVAGSQPDRHDNTVTLMRCESGLEVSE